MSARPSPAVEVVTRVHGLGEKAILQFFDEVPSEVVRSLVRFLPPVDGFRTTSTAGIQQRKRTLAKKLASKPTVASLGGDRDYRALYVLWRAWASEHICDPEAIEALLDTIEEAEDDLEAPPEGPSMTPNKAVTAAFTTLKSWSLENKCTREQIERFFIFSPFAGTAEIHELIRASKASIDVDRDAAFAGLPQRLQHDREEVQALKAKLSALTIDLDSAKSGASELRGALVSLQATVKTLSESHTTLHASINKQAANLETIGASLQAHDAFRREVADKRQRWERELADTTDAVRKLGADALKRDELESISNAIAKIERLLAHETQSHSSSIATIRNDLNSLSERLEGLSRRSAQQDQLGTLTLRVAALEASQGAASLVRGPPTSNETTDAQGRAFYPIDHLSVRSLSDSASLHVQTIETVAAFREVLSVQLQALGLKKSAAQIFASEIAAASLAGQLVFFKGAFATEVAFSCARAASADNSYRISIPIGLNSGEGVRRALHAVSASGADKITAVAVDGVNRSALDVFADSLVDLAGSSPLGAPTSAPPTLFYASIHRSVAALPVEPCYLERGPIFDLDHLDWRSRGPDSSEVAPSRLSLSAHRQAREQIGSKPIDNEELLRQQRKYALKRNPRMERTFAAAHSAMHFVRDQRDAPTPLQSLAFGWLGPLWISLGISREEADSELDAGKCDSDRPDARIASMLATDFPSRPSERGR